jgi:hypothetical protein
LINPYGLTNDSLHISANTKKTFHASYTVPYDLNILSLTPQANLICRSWEVYAELPGESVPIKLLKIKDWNFNWKQTYHLAIPVFLPKGTIIHCLALYDNTLENLCNPSDNPVDIGWGAHLFSELFFVHFEFSPADTPYTVPMVLPAVTASDSIPLSIPLDKRSRYRLSVSRPDGTGEIYIGTYKLKRGVARMDINLSALACGNYVMQIRNKRHEPVAEQLFMKIREKGM